MPPPPPLPPQGAPSPYGYAGPPPQSGTPGPPAQASAPYYGGQPPNAPGGNYFVPTPGPVFVPTGVQRNKWKRPLIALAIAALFIGGATTVGVLDDSPPSAEHAEVGDCVHNKGDVIDPYFVVVDCGGPKAEYRVASIPEDTDKCPPTYDTYQRTRNSVVEFTLCLSEIPHQSNPTRDL